MGQNQYPCFAYAQTGNSLGAGGLGKNKVVDPKGLQPGLSVYSVL